MWFIRVNSGLGPNFLVCSGCQTKMKTNNKEWQQMSWKEKLWYLVLSIFYGVILGFMTSIIIMVANEKIFRLPLSSGDAWLLIVAPIALIIFFIQLIRIELSIGRMENNKESSKTVSFWDWETNLQFYGMVWIILIVLSSIPLVF
jgi:SNF family Na+-dependent transporter